MTLNEYQEQALRTKNPELSEKEQIINCVMGLNGETGEITDVVKKWLYQGHPLDKKKLVYEMGDLMWYLGNLAKALGVDLDEVGEFNIEKLKLRYPQGFDAEHSMHRREGDI